MMLNHYKSIIRTHEIIQEQNLIRQPYIDVRILSSFHRNLLLFAFELQEMESKSVFNILFEREY